MKQTKCDICGEVFSAWRGQGYSARGGSKLKGKVVHVHAFRTDGEYDCNHQSVHICDTCANKLKLSKNTLLKLLKARYKAL